MKLGRTLLIGLSLVLGLLIAVPDSAEAQSRWAPYGRQVHRGYYGYNYSPYRYRGYSPGYYSYGYYPRYGASYYSQPYYYNFYGVGPNYWNATPYPRYRY